MQYLLRFLAPLQSSSLLRLIMLGGAIAAFILIAIVLTYSFVFGPANRQDITQREFIVSPDQTVDDIAYALTQEGLIKHAFVFSLLAPSRAPESGVRPGGYRLSPSMDIWTVLHTFTEAPYLAWVNVPEGWRKEQIAELLADTLGWDEEDRAVYLSARSVSPEFSEGVYYPGVYLIPSDLPPEFIAGRMRSKFQDELAPYWSRITESELSWEDIVTFASLIERESAKNDKHLVAGILTNRLKKGMLLQVDATLQYVTGTEENHWWSAPNADDKYLDSPFNTYKYEGLPPAPIATPSIASIEAVLDPEATSCLYYLHDTYGRIHCSPTYKGHLANVNRYLK